MANKLLVRFGNHTDSKYRITKFEYLENHQFGITYEVGTKVYWIKIPVEDIFKDGVLDIEEIFKKIDFNNRPDKLFHLWE